jgi:hypothetical protein
MDNFSEKIGVDIPDVEEPSLFEDIKFEKPSLKEFSIPMEKEVYKIPKPVYHRFKSKLAELGDKVINWVVEDEGITVVSSELIDLEMAKEFSEKNKNEDIQVMLYRFGTGGSKILQTSFSEIQSSEDFDYINKVNENCLQDILKFCGNFFYFFNEYKKKELSPTKGLVGKIEEYRTRISNEIDDLKHVKKSSAHKQKVDRIHKLSKSLESFIDEFHEKARDFKRHALIFVTFIMYLGMQVVMYDTALEILITKLVRMKEKKAKHVGVKLVTIEEKKFTKALGSLYAKRMAEFGHRYVSDTVKLLREFINFSKKEEYKSITGIDEVLKVIKEMCEDKSEKMKDIVELCTSDDYKTNGEYTREFHDDVLYVIDAVYEAIRSNVADRIFESRVKNDKKLIYDETKTEELERKYLNEVDHLFTRIVKMIDFYDDLFSTQDIVRKEVSDTINKIKKGIEKSETEKEEEVVVVKTVIEKPIGSFLYGDVPGPGAVVIAAGYHALVQVSLSLLDIYNAVNVDRTSMMQRLYDYLWPEGEKKEEQGVMARIFGGVLGIPGWILTKTLELFTYIPFVEGLIEFFKKAFNIPITAINYALSMFSVWNIPEVTVLYNWLSVILNEISKHRKSPKGLRYILGSKLTHILVYTFGVIGLGALVGIFPAGLPLIAGFMFSGIFMRSFEALTEWIADGLNLFLNPILRVSRIRKQNIISDHAAGVLFFFLMNVLNDTFYNLFSDRTLLLGGITQLLFTFSPIYLYTMWMYILFENSFDRNRRFIMKVIRKLLRKSINIENKSVEKRMIWAIYIIIRNGSLLALNYYVPKTRHPLIYNKKMSVFTPDPEELHPHIDPNQADIIDETEEEVEKNEEGWFEGPKKLFKDTYKEVKEKVFGAEKSPYDSRVEQAENIKKVAKGLEKDKKMGFWATALRSIFKTRENDKKYFVGHAAGFKQPLKSAIFRIIRKTAFVDLIPGIKLDPLGSVAHYQIASALFEYVTLELDNLIDFVYPATVNGPNDNDAQQLTPQMSSPALIREGSRSLETFQRVIKGAAAQIVQGGILNVNFFLIQQPNKRQSPDRVNEGIDNELKRQQGLKAITMSDKIQSKIYESISKTGVPCSLIDVCNMIDEDDYFVNKKQKKEEVKKNWDSLVKSFYRE